MLIYLSQAEYWNRTSIALGSELKFGDTDLGLYTMYY